MPIKVDSPMVDARGRGGGRVGGATLGVMMTFHVAGESNDGGDTGAHPYPQP